VSDDLVGLEFRPVAWIEDTSVRTPVDVQVRRPRRVAPLTNREGPRKRNVDGPRIRAGLERPLVAPDTRANANDDSEHGASADLHALRSLVRDRVKPTLVLARTQEILEAGPEEQPREQDQEHCSDRQGNADGDGLVEPALVETPALQNAAEPLDDEGDDEQPDQAEEDSGPRASPAPPPPHLTP